MSNENYYERNLLNNESFYSIKGVHYAPIIVVRDYVRRFLPPGVHFLMTAGQLRITALKIMDKYGLLSERDSYLLNIPLFGESYIESDGDLGQALLRSGFDLIPGISFISDLIQ